MDEFLNPAVPPVDVAAEPPDRTYAMWTHLAGLLGYVLGPLAIIVPLALWVSRKDQSPFIDDHGCEATNFNITLWIYTFLAIPLTFVCIGGFILGALFIFQIIVVILAATRASAGQYWRYPITIRLIR